MNIPESRSAARYPDWTTDSDKYEVPVEPADPGPIHAWLYSAPPTDPKGQLRRYILAKPKTVLLEDRQYVEAACGTSLRVIYPWPFELDEANVCPKCIEMARLWQAQPAEYRRVVAERHQRWEERRRRKYQAMDDDDWERQERYGSDPIDGDDDSTDE